MLFRGRRLCLALVGAAVASALAPAAAGAAQVGYSSLGGFRVYVAFFGDMTNDAVELTGADGLYTFRAGTAIETDVPCVPGDVQRRSAICTTRDLVQPNPLEFLPVYVQLARGDDVFTDRSDAVPLVIGKRGADLIQAGAGSAGIVAHGEDGDDTLRGGPGPDRLVDFLGNNQVSGRGGRDYVNTDHPGAGQFDSVECGAGMDTARVDAVDAVAPDCEQVTVDGS